jgi:hypothetical protein
MASEYLRTHSHETKITASVNSMEKFLEDSDSHFKPFIEKPAPPEKAEEPETKKEPIMKLEQSADGKATKIATGCVPCAMGHFGTCSGILNESVRFAHGEDGVASPEVIDRVNMCMDELNAMERVDLRPEMTTQLTGWEKELAERALTESRATRHALEGLTDVEGLEKAAAAVQTTRKEIGRQWFQKKLNALSPQDKEEISRRVMAKIDEMAMTEAEPAETVSVEET